MATRIPGTTREFRLPQSLRLGEHDYPVVRQQRRAPCAWNMRSASVSRSVSSKLAGSGKR